MLIKQFKFDSFLINEFIDLEYELYKGDPNWIPPIKTNIYQQLSKEFPFYHKTGNSHCHFLLYEDGSPKARVTAMINADLKDESNQPIGLIGFFECHKNYHHAESLLNKALSWLNQQNITKVWGPINFDIWHSYRFMTEGFDQDLFLGEPYNPNYYPTYFEQYGFVQKAEWDSVEISDKEILKQMTIRGEKRFHLLKNRGYRFELADINNYDDLINKLHPVICSSFVNFLGFTPIDKSEFKQLFNKARHAFHPKMTLFAYDNENNIAGFAVAVLELANAVKAMNGKADVISKIKFNYLKHKVNRINFYIGGVTPDEMTKRSGLGRAGFYYILNEILKAGYEKVLLTLRLKGNAAHGLPGRLSPKPQREYKLYEIEL